MTIHLRTIGQLLDDELEDVPSEEEREQLKRQIKTSLLSRADDFFPGQRDLTEESLLGMMLTEDLDFRIRHPIQRELYNRGYI